MFTMFQLNQTSESQPVAPKVTTLINRGQVSPRKMPRIVLNSSEKGWIVDLDCGDYTSNWVSNSQDLNQVLMQVLAVAGVEVTVVDKSNLLLP